MPNLYDVYVLDESAYVNINERTKRNPTAKLLLWMWFVLFNRNVEKDMFNMLGSYYKAKNLSFHREQARSAPSAAKQAVGIAPIMIAASCKPPQSNLRDVQNRAQSNNQDLQSWHQKDNTKRATEVLLYFRDRYYNGNKRQSINRMNREYEVCAAQLSLSDDKKAAFFCKCT